MKRPATSISKKRFGAAVWSVFAFSLLLTAGTASAGVTPLKGGPEIDGYRCLYYPIPYPKLADSIWDCAAGPDGKIYLGICSEHSGGSAHLIAFDPATETFEEIFDAQVVTNSPADRMPQGKIHFTLNAHPDGRLFGATHFGYLKSSPEEPNPNPQNLDDWNRLLTDPGRGYPGGHLFVYDTKTKQARDLGIPVEFQGVRVMTLDTVRGHLYGLVGPRQLPLPPRHQERRDEGGRQGRRLQSLRHGGRPEGRHDVHRRRNRPDDRLSSRMEKDPPPFAVTIPGAANAKDDVLTVFVAGPDGRFYGADHVVKHLFRYDPTVRTGGNGDRSRPVSAARSGLLRDRIARL